MIFAQLDLAKSKTKNDGLMLSVRKQKNNKAYENSSQNNHTYKIWIVWNYKLPFSERMSVLTLDGEPMLHSNNTR